MEMLQSEWPFPQFVAFAYALPRLLAMFSLIPMLSRQSLPGVLRVGVSGCIALLVVPLLQEPAMAAERSAAMTILIVLKEMLIGAIIGFIAVIPFWAFESMGAIVDMQRGANLAEVFNPLSQQETSPLGQMFSQAAVTFLFVTGGFAALLRAVYDSYRIWPVFQWRPVFSVASPDLLLGQLDRLTSLAVLWGAPVICIMFLAELGLGLVSRFAPQLQVFFMAMPVKSALGVFTLAVYVTTLFEYADGEMRNLGVGIVGTLHDLFR